jgi:2-(1,2-epoxy-1,2-dihydrophenyl)acetyl-CoA isomerase
MGKEAIMSDHQTLLVEPSNGVLRITLNRPEKYNALTGVMAQEIIEVCKQAGRDPAVRAVLLTGAGKGFCAGQDLGEVEGREADFSFRDHLLQGYNRMAMALRSLEKPVVVAVNGACAGAGLGLALAGDIRYASDQAKFLTAFIGIGLAPDTGVSYWLPRLIGPGRAAELLFSNDRLEAARAAEIGLVNRVVPQAELLSESLALAERLAQGPTLGIGLSKRALNKSLGLNLEDQLDYEAHLQEVAGHSADYSEGVAAFREKRPPNFQGN